MPNPKIKISSFPYLQKLCLPSADKYDEGRCLKKPIKGEQAQSVGYGKQPKAG